MQNSPPSRLFQVHENDMIETGLEHLLYFGLQQQHLFLIGHLDVTQNVDLSASEPVCSNSLAKR